jgi:hypothetical protein
VVEDTRGDHEIEVAAEIFDPFDRKEVQVEVVDAVGPRQSTLVVE